MAHTNINRPLGKLDDPSSVIAFQAGTEWSSEMHLDLNDHLVTHPSATFFLRVKGNSPYHGAIRDDDILIVDRALTPDSNSTIIAVIDGALVIVPYRSLARYRQQGGSDNQLEDPLISAEPAVWGVVTYSIHRI
jgi:DNA polymerase V